MKNIQNVIIHDCARCFIKEFHIKTILDMNYKYKYSQYYLKLINGLYKKNSQTYEDVNRDDYIELMTPLCINFYLAYYIFITYMEKQHRITYEFITILNLLKIPCNMIEGHISFLKKITTIEDIL
jgi:2-C-methyl-D-erythritol 4-phosphate cytidylyltransferase